MPTARVRSAPDQCVGLLCAVNDGMKVDVELASDRGHRLVVELDDGHDAGVVDQNVDRAEDVLDLVQERGETSVLGDVRRRRPVPVVGQPGQRRNGPLQCLGEPGVCRVRQGEDPLGAALEQLDAASLAGQTADDLDAGRPGPDHRDPLAGQWHLVTGRSGTPHRRSRPGP
jgi:hypothetical protein